MLEFIVEMNGLSILGKMKEQKPFKTINNEVRRFVGKANFYYYL
jgi:hypothetical protein